MKKKLWMGCGLLLVYLLPAVTVLADTDVGTQASGTNVLSWISLVLALLAMAAAVVLFLGARKAILEQREEIAALSRRCKELEGELNRRRERVGGAQEELSLRLTRAEQIIEEMDEALTQLEHAYRQSSVSRPAEAPATSVPVSPARPSYVPPAAAVPRGSAPVQDEIARMNRVLDGSDQPDRAMQRYFTPSELKRIEMLHYVRPSLKMQDQEYAQFCAYDRINPGNVSLVKLGQYVMPSKLSLNGQAIFDWYDVVRATDKENPAPHMVIIEPALAHMSSESVVNESQESKRLITVEKKGSLRACNL